MYLDQYSGRGVRIAVIDSGVHAAHPHVGGVAGGFAIAEDGSLVDDFVDRLGHGTAVVATIKEKAPDAEILAVKVFWRALATDVTTLVRAIEEASARGAALVNLSLGTAEMKHRAALETAVDRATARGSIVVSALDSGGVAWLPGSLDGVLAVQLDWACERSAYRICEQGGRRSVSASGYPRDIPGVPRERNLKGISFAVANVAAFAARALEASGRPSAPSLLDILAADLPQRAAV
jgi:subtilisin family serine protease